MHYADLDQQTALTYIHECATIAQQSTCQRSRCGSVIVKDNEVIGTGFNSPPGHLEDQRRCMNDKSLYHRKVSDRSCCVHAEQRAIMEALSKNPSKIKGARLYFVRLDEQGNPQHSGQPWCTICSKMALDSGIAEFVLWHKEGVGIYPTDEYNTLSYQYQG